MDYVAFVQSYVMFLMEKMGYKNQDALEEAIAAYEYIINKQSEKP